MKYSILIICALLSTSACNENKAKSDTSKNTDTAPVQEVKQESTDVQVSDPWNDIKDISGDATITGKFTNAQMDNKLLYLYESEGNTLYPADSIVVKNQSFAFPTREYPIGVYHLGFGINNTAPIVLNPNEGEVEVMIKPGNLANGMTIIKSEDSKVWQQYQKSDLRFFNQVRSLKQQRGRAAEAQKDQFIDKIYAKEDERAASHMALANANPGTFTAKIAHRFRSPEHRSKSKFWDDIDFTDQSYVRSNLISNRIQDYMRGHSGGTETGFLNCVDLLMGKAKADEKMFEFVLFTLLEGFYSSGRDDICNYILNDYYFGDACGDIELSDYSLVKASRIKNLQIGNTPPDFTINDLSGKMVNLKKETEKNKYTLIFFWSSWCHTCEAEIPVLKSVYNQHKANGFGVIGVSVDTEDGAWRNAVNSRSLEWPNVSQLMGWKSPVAKDYRVSKTPGIFLLDNEMKIVMKPKSINQIKGFLAKNM